jgi:hypothetical protein
MFFPISLYKGILVFSIHFHIFFATFLSAIIRTKNIQEWQSLNVSGQVARLKNKTISPISQETTKFGPQSSLVRPDYQQPEIQGG